MGLRQLEAAILSELRHVTGNRRIRQRDIMEWSTGKVEARGDEKLVHLPLNRVNVAYLEPPRKKR